MVSSRKRIAIASIVSLIGCLSTFIWHLKTEPKQFGGSNSDVIAYIANAKYEIHRKGANNTLWEPAEQLDRLRAGDSVRTSGKSEARIQFYQSNRYIDLEPDSMIVIQKQESEISLELLEGSLFVNGVDQNSKNALTLKSQGGKVDLSKSAAQLSGSSNAAMDLKVLKGSAQLVKQGGKVEAILEGKEGGIEAAGLRVKPDQVRILSPETTKPTYINALKPEPILIQWTGFPNNAQVSLESGPSRKKLVPTNAEKLSTTQMQISWKPGIYYWQLKAMDPETKKLLGQSSIFKTEIVGRFPPTPVSPEPNFVLQTRRNFESVTLRWNATPEYKDVFVELKNDSTNKMILSEKFPISQDFKDLNNLPLGNYSWRLTGYPTDGGKPISGPFYPLSINQKRVIRVPLVWNPNLKPTQYYVNSDPKLTLMWEPDESERVKKYSVYIAPEGTDPVKTQPIEARQIKYEKVVPKPGRYLAFVEAFDEDGDKIGTSETRTFDVAALPLLTAPVLQPENTNEYLARPDGSLNLQWDNLEGAKDYQVLVRDPEGKIVGEYSTEDLYYKLVNLMPGQYSLQVSATDNYGRRGALSLKRSIIVPDKSEVQAPKLRKIKVN